MSRPALEVADIFRGHGPAWRQANAGHVSLGQLKVMSAIENCRTAALGGHVTRCENEKCGPPPMPRGSKWSRTLATHGTNGKPCNHSGCACCWVRWQSVGASMIAAPTSSLPRRKLTHHITPFPCGIRIIFGPIVAFPCARDGHYAIATVWRHARIDAAVRHGVADYRRDGCADRRLG
jgi:Transposase zinc-binding domain